MINLEQTFSPRVNPADANYPFGSIKDNTSPGANDGTPLSAVWGNDGEDWWVCNDIGCQWMEPA